TYRYYINKKDFAYIVLDEVHKIEGWEKWVRIMLEKKEKVKIIITGSGSKILTPKLASVLTGRKVTYYLFPLSVKDFLKFKNINKKYFTKKEINSLLREYIEFGSIPLSVLAEKPEQKKYFLQEVYDDIITKDIMLKYKLREERILRKTAYFVINSFSKYISIRKLRNSLKTIMKINVSPTSLSYYLEYFEKSFLFIFLPIFSHNIKDQMQYPKKVYCIDTGIINSIIPRFSENIGRYYENVVALKLKRDKKEIYYWKNKGEIDFVIKEGLKVKQLIQVCYNINKETKKHEIKALIEASKKLRCRNLLIITEDYESEEKINKKKIKFIPLWKWLLK
ncbi:MAG: ATP-binding protein, partial [Candidatus Aenigmarchaeota archaeon]|nr:ATP-binding protein [Candidatus Aenigmarchaeota archaeon]